MRQEEIDYIKYGIEPPREQDPRTRETSCTNCRYGLLNMFKGGPLAFCRRGDYLSSGYPDPSNNGAKCKCHNFSAADLKRFSTEEDLRRAHR